MAFGTAKSVLFKQCVLIRGVPLYFWTVCSKLLNLWFGIVNLTCSGSSCFCSCVEGKSKVSAGTEGKKPVSESAKEPVTVDIKPVIKENTFSSDPILDEVHAIFIRC